jgi:acetyl esterase/lipase
MYRHCLIAVLLAIFLVSCTTPTPEQAAQDPNITPEGVRITPDVVYGHKFGMALTFDMFQPKNQNGAGVILINSGGWVSMFPNIYERTDDGIRLRTQGFEFAESLLSKGTTVFWVRHGSSPKFEMQEIVSDLRRAVRFIRFHAKGYGIDAERLGLMGGSAGGHLSLLLATTAEISNSEAAEEFEKGTGRVAAVVAYFPPTDLKSVVDYLIKNDPETVKQLPALDLGDDQLKEFSPINFVSSDDPPILIIQGNNDPVIPVDQGESMYQALQEEGVESKFVIIPGAGHGFEGEDADLALNEAVSWFEKHLSEK